MIVEKYGDPQGGGYARVLIADYHLEYPLEDPPEEEGEVRGFTRCYLLWDPYNVEEIRDFLRGRLGLSYDEAQDDPEPFEALEDKLFPDLERRYNGHYEHGMGLWLLQGAVPDLERIFYAHADAVSQPPSGDDSVFDYWPNALDMLIVFAHDLHELTNDKKYYDRIKEAFTAVEAAMGPAAEWEADGYKAEVEAL